MREDRAAHARFSEGPAKKLIRQRGFASKALDYSPEASDLGNCELSASARAQACALAHAHWKL